MANSQEGWQLVTRRRKQPATSTTPTTQPPVTSKPYVPFSKPSYSQILTTSPTLSTPSNSPPFSGPSSPKTPPSTFFYISPHSPTRLRFPPSPTYPEWRGRCFNCCRRGHNKVDCRNPTKCGKCWLDGHTGFRCHTAPTSFPLREIATPPPKLHEPTYEDLLEGPYPTEPPEMPEDRPDRVRCFIERDSELEQEIARLTEAVVITIENVDHGYSTDEIIKMATQTGVVQPSEVQVATLPRDRLLLTLPKAMAAETFIGATPPEMWDMGFSFQKWSPLDDAYVTVPVFKILLELQGLPPQLWREKEVIRALSNMGTYLGSLSSDHEANLTAWRAVIATTDLKLITKNIDMVVGGLEYPVKVMPIHWIHKSLYSPADFPQPPPKFHKPADRREEQKFDGESVTLSKHALLEMIQNCDPKKLPMEVKDMLKEPSTERWCGSMSARRKEAEELERQAVTLNMAPHTMATQTKQHTIRSIVVSQGSREADCVEEEKEENTQRDPPVPQTIPNQGVDRCKETNQSREESAWKHTPSRSPRGNQPQIAAHMAVPLSPNKELSIPGTMKGDMPVSTCVGDESRDVDDMAVDTQGHLYQTRKMVTRERKKSVLNWEAQEFHTGQTSGAHKMINITKSPEGLYKVSMGREQCKQLAASCGLTIEDVIQTIEEDNNEKKIEYSPQEEHEMSSNTKGKYIMRPGSTPIRIAPLTDDKLSD